MKAVIGCELCDSPAKTYCESDRARLCWSCDAKVHAANFLVAKHSRTLLCHHCQAQTPWAASGPKLAPSLSFCLSCLSSQAQTQSRTQALNSSPQLADLNDHDHDHDHDESISCDDDHRIERYSDDDDDDEHDYDDDDDDDEDDDDDDDDDDEENQVVPWASSAQVNSGSEVEDYNSNGGFKRKREIAFLHSADNFVRF